MHALMLGLGMAAALVAAAAPAPALAAGFTVVTPDFTNGGMISMAQVFGACQGRNHSPALSWSGEPAGTQSFAVTLFDPDAPTGSGFWHWTLFDIPASVHSLPAGAGDAGSIALPPGAVEGRIDFGLNHYAGPCPPPGPPHHYELTVYAVKIAKLPLDADASGARVGFQLHYNTLAKAQIVGLYGRPK